MCLLHCKQHMVVQQCGLLQQSGKWLTTFHLWSLFYFQIYSFTLSFVDWLSSAGLWLVDQIVPVQSETKTGVCKRIGWATESSKKKSNTKNVSNLYSHMICTHGKHQERKEMKKPLVLYLLNHTTYIDKNMCKGWHEGQEWLFPHHLQIKCFLKKKLEKLWERSFICYPYVGEFWNHCW